MPLTFAHPIAVLPLRRCGLPLSALIVGSIAPDLEFLLHLAPSQNIGHTATGLFVFCLPMGLVTLWIFHRIWRKPILSLLAEDLGMSQNEGLAAFPFWPFRRLAVLSAAVLIGALSHLVWDSFTHQSGWAVQHVPTLGAVSLESHWGSVPFFKLLQHGSTFLGLVVLATMALRKGMISHISHTGRRHIVFVVCISVAMGLAFALMKSFHFSGLRATEWFVGMLVVHASVAAIAYITLVSLIWHAKEMHALVSKADR